MFSFAVDYEATRDHVLNMFTSGLHRAWRHLEASVREGRLHRWIVVPAVLSILIALARAEVLWAIALAPPLVALPFVAAASLARTNSLVPPAGAAAINVIGWFAFAWSLVMAILAPLYGALAAGATVPLLIPNRGAPKRLAFITTWLGAVGIVAMFPLAWLEVPPVALGIGSTLLVAGGAVWMMSALLAGSAVDVDLPRATAISHAA